MAAQSPSPSGSQTADTYPPFDGVSAFAEPLDVTQDRQWATLAHLGGVLGALPSYVIHRVFAERGPFTEQESREALNYSLLPTLAIVVCTVLSILPAIGWVFGLAAALLWMVMAVRSVIAGLKVNRGEPYTYPGSSHLFDKIVAKRAQRS